MATERSRAAELALVAVGGAVGAPLRYRLSQTLPHEPGALPAATLLANLMGAFALGLLLAALLRRGPDTGRRRDLRLALGTGLLGAFTTFSSLALEVELLRRGGRVGLALGYGLGSVLLGVGAAAAGVALAGVGRR